MSLTNKALFVIERNLRSDLSLDQIARYCDVSRFHLAHAFGEATGLSVVEYRRARRLTEAAYALAAGASDILGVALDTGCASHEAFSRAFKAQFGKTPEEVRKSESVDGLKLVAPIGHLETKAMKLKEPRFEKAGELLFVGLSEHIAYGAMQNIATLWQRFMRTYYGDIDHKLPETPVGITTASDGEGIRHVAAAGVSKFGGVNRDLVKLTLKPQTYVVFAHDGNVTQIRETYQAIWNDWFPKSGMSPVEAPGLERHNATFDPRTGNGGITIWLPLK